MLAALSAADQDRLVEAMRVIEELLGGRAAARAPYLLRPHRPGDMGWVVQRHGALYAQEYGLNEEFEALVATIVARFVQRYDHARERCWIAEKDGEPVGSVFLVKASPKVAQLRLLLVEPSRAGPRDRRAPRRGVRALRAERRLPEDHPLDQQRARRRAPHLREGRVSAGRLGAPPELRPRPGRRNVGAPALSMTGRPRPRRTPR